MDPPRYEDPEEGPSLINYWRQNQIRNGAAVDPEPVEKQVTEQDVNEYMQKLREPVNKKMAAVNQNRAARSGLSNEQRITRLEQILEGLYPFGFPSTAPQSDDELWEELKSITRERAEALLREQYHNEFVHERASWNRRNGYISLSPQYRSEPMSMASASVVDDVFSKFYKTGLHAQ